MRSQQDLSIRVLFLLPNKEHASHGHGITSCRRPWSWRKRGDVVGVGVGKPCLPPNPEDTIQVEGHVTVSAKIRSNRRSIGSARRHSGEDRRRSDYFELARYFELYRGTVQNPTIKT